MFGVAVTRAFSLVCADDCLIPEVGCGCTHHFVPMLVVSLVIIVASWVAYILVVSQLSVILWISIITSVIFPTSLVLTIDPITSISCIIAVCIYTRLFSLMLLCAFAIFLFMHLSFAICTVSTVIWISLLVSSLIWVISGSISIFVSLFWLLPWILLIWESLIPWCFVWFSSIAILIPYLLI